MESQCRGAILQEVLSMLTQFKKPSNDHINDSHNQPISNPTSRRALLACGIAGAIGSITGIASAQQFPLKKQKNPFGKSVQSGREKPLTLSGRNRPVGSRPPGTNAGTLTTGQNSGNVVNTGSSQVRGWNSPNKRLLRRISYGPLASEIQEIESIGYNAYLENQLNYASIDDSACEALIGSAVPNFNLTVEEVNQISQGNAYFGSEAAAHAMIIRSAKSNRQLYQRMFEFMHGHFYMFSSSHLAHYLIYERDVIWANCMGTFKDILVATANSGMMMLYLDNRLSSAHSINVNYARELLELHTVGVNGGFTEEDIYQVADIFTGWGIEDSNAQLQRMTFKYTDSRHAHGVRTVMGQTFTQTGKAQGDELLSWLANHPATIKHLADKLSMWFLGRPATPQLLTEIGDVWGTDGDIKAVLRVILSEQNMSQIQPIFKRPFHLIVGAIRQSESNVTNVYWVRDYLKLAGHETGGWVQPDGFPNGFNYWSGGLVSRFQMMTHYAAGRYQNVPSIDTSVMDGMTDGERVTYINDAFFLGELPVSDQIWMRRYMKGNSKHRQAVAIALCSPAYQWF